MQALQSIIHYARRAGRLKQLTVTILLLAIVFVLVLKGLLAARLNVNWDEFFFLSRVHEHARGALSLRMQTFHVHLFGWLPRRNEVDQILFARYVLLIFRVGTCVCLFIVVRKLYGALAASFSILIGLSFSHVMRHGESFRFDPIISFLFALSMCLLITRRDRLVARVVAGGAAALALLVSIKAALYLPSLVLVALIIDDTRAQRIRNLLWFGASLSASWVLLTAFHRWSIAPPLPSSRGQDLATKVDRVLFGGQFFPRQSVFLDTLSWDRAYWILIAAGFVAALAMSVRGGDQRKSAFLGLAFLIPLASTLLYRNAWAYYYVCIVPFAAVVAGGLIHLIERSVKGHQWVLLPAIGLLAAPSTVQAWRFHQLNSDDDVSHQRELIERIREMFPESTPYLDRCRMVSQYPSAGPFMSTFTLEAYRDRGAPIMRDILAAKQPAFVLINSSGLELFRPHRPGSHALLPEDHETLRSNYVPHWGPVWIAGKSVPTDVPSRPVAFEIPVRGVYRLEGRGMYEVDGQRFQAGDLVMIEPGEHVVESEVGAQLALRLDVERPVAPPPSSRIFRGLGFQNGVP
jgi:hypothetical protein